MAMKPKKKRRGNGDRVIAVPQPVHRKFAAIAEQRYMKLRHVPGFLIELVEVVTPEQIDAAMSRYSSRAAQTA